MKTYPSILLTLFSLLFVGCSTNTNSPSKIKYKYSSELTKTPEQLQRERAIEYYRLLRQTNGASARKTAPRPIKKKVPKKKILVNIEEQKMEIKQNLAYYCMRHRKSSRFAEEGSCNTYTVNVFENCRERYAMGEKGLLKCVKSQLR